MFSATITSGGLLLQESRILAELLLAGSSPDELLAMTLERNLLQKRSPMTTRKMVRLIIPRLADMERGFLEIVARGDKQEASLLLLASMITCHRLIGDFLLYIGRECIAQYKTAVTFQDWKQFLVQCAQLQPNVESWSPATVKKLKNVVFRLKAAYWKAKRIGFCRCSCPNLFRHICHPQTVCMPASVWRGCCESGRPPERGL